jgi:hypothetical protein
MCICIYTVYMMYTVYICIYYITCTVHTYILYTLCYCTTYYMTHNILFTNYCIICMCVTGYYSILYMYTVHYTYAYYIGTYTIWSISSHHVSCIWYESISLSYLLTTYCSICTVYVHSICTHLLYKYVWSFIPVSMLILWER